MKLNIEYVPISEITPYAGNAKLHPAEQVEQIKESIRQFGFADPIAVWHGEVVEGHGRLIAANELGLDTVPVIRLDDLTDEQRRAYTLIHNKLTMNSGFEMDLLQIELENIESIDMEQFGFDIEDFTEDEPDEDEFVEPSMSHNVFENQEKRQYDTDNWYGIPELPAIDITGDKLLRFCDFNQIEDHENYIAHFFYDDFKFINAWRQPDKYVDKLKKFKAVVSPDFSLYTDFPRALQILSCYRRNWCGLYWHELGIPIIPDVVWGDEESYKFCFLGLPKHSTVAVSTVGVTNDDDWNNKADSLFVKGYNEMMNRLEPTTVILYGSEIEGLEGNIIRVPSFYEERRGGLPTKGDKDGSWEI